MYGSGLESPSHFFYCDENCYGQDRSDRSGSDGPVYYSTLFQYIKGGISRSHDVPERVIDFRAQKSMPPDEQAQ